MRRIKVICYVLLAIAFPLTVIILSGNVALRVPETYVFYFNDSQAADRVSSQITAANFGDEIAGYFNSLHDGGFQVYEDNGPYSDPLFTDDEVLVMAQARKLMMSGVVVSLAGLACVIVCYTVLRRRTEKRRLRTFGCIIVPVTAVLDALLCHALTRPDFRAALYRSFIGIGLGKDSSLRRLLGSPFQNTFMMFAGIIAAVLLLLALYAVIRSTREERMFY